MHASNDATRFGSSLLEHVVVDACDARASFAPPGVKRLLLMTLLVTASCGTSGALTFGATDPWKEGPSAMNRSRWCSRSTRWTRDSEQTAPPLRIAFQDDEGTQPASEPRVTRALSLSTEKDIVAVRQPRQTAAR